MILRLFKSWRGDGGRARQRLVWTLLSAGRHSHSPKDQPLGYSFGSPCPAQVYYLPLSFSLVPGNKWAGQGKVLAAGDEKNQNKTKQHPLSAERCEEWKPRAWLAEPVSQEGAGSPTLFWRRPGSLVGAGEPSRDVRGPPGLLFRRWLPVLAAQPAGPPHGPGQRGG